MGTCPLVLCYVCLIEDYHNEAHRNHPVLGNVMVMERDLSFLSALSIGFHLFMIICSLCTPLCALLRFARISDLYSVQFSQLVRRQSEDIVLTSNLSQKLVLVMSWTEQDGT